MNKASVFGEKAAEPRLETMNNIIFDIIRLNMNEFGNYTQNTHWFASLGLREKYSRKMANQ